MANEAGRRSSTTASPVTSSSGSTRSETPSGSRPDADMIRGYRSPSGPARRLAPWTSTPSPLCTGPSGTSSRSWEAAPADRAEADELVDLYQRAATHLSVVRSASSDPLIVGRLSRIVATGRTALTGGHEPLGRELARLATVSFPAAVWRSRWWSAACAASTVVIALLVGFWVAGNRDVQAALGTDEEIRQLVEVDFANYYSEHPATSFAASVWTNNAWVAAQCVAFGITGVLAWSR